MQFKQVLVLERLITVESKNLTEISSDLQSKRLEEILRNGKQRSS